MSDDVDALINKFTYAWGKRTSAAPLRFADLHLIHAPRDEKNICKMKGIILDRVRNRSLNKQNICNPSYACATILESDDPYVEHNYFLALLDLIREDPTVLNLCRESINPYIARPISPA